MAGTAAAAPPLTRGGLDWAMATGEHHPLPADLALERAALDRWGHGDPDGYLPSTQPMSPTSIPTWSRLDGLPALTAGTKDPRKIEVDHDEIVNPRVQVVATPPS